VQFALPFPRSGCHGFSPWQLRLRIFAWCSTLAFVEELLHAELAEDAHVDCEPPALFG
jgi:hypothetical protein